MGLFAPPFGHMTCLLVQGNMGQRHIYMYMRDLYILVLHSPLMRRYGFGRWQLRCQLQLRLGTPTVVGSVIWWQLCGESGPTEQSAATAEGRGDEQQRKMLSLFLGTQEGGTRCRLFPHIQMCCFSAYPVIYVPAASLLSEYVQEPPRLGQPLAGPPCAASRYEPAPCPIASRLPDVYREGSVCDCRNSSLNRVSSSGKSSGKTKAILSYLMPDAALPLLPLVLLNFLRGNLQTPTLTTSPFQVNRPFGIA